MNASATDFPLPLPSEAEKEEYEPEAPPVGAYRSVDDVRMLRRVSIAALIQSLLLVVSVGVIAILATRPAQQVVIERTTEGDRVVAINGKPVAVGYAVGEEITHKPGIRGAVLLLRAMSRHGVERVTRRTLEPYLGCLARDGEDEKNLYAALATLELAANRSHVVIDEAVRLEFEKARLRLCGEEEVAA